MFVLPLPLPLFLPLLFLKSINKSSGEDLKILLVLRSTWYTHLVLRLGHFSWTSADAGG